MKLCCPLRSVCLSSLLSLFGIEKKRIYLFSLFKQKKKIIEDLSLLIEMFSLKLRSAPLICLV